MGILNDYKVQHSLRINMEDFRGKEKGFDRAPSSVWIELINNE